MIAKEKKPYNVGETMIKAFMFKAADRVLEKTYSKKLAKITGSTIKTPIDELAKNIDYQVLKKLQASPFFNSMC